MDPMIQKYLADKYALNEEEQATLSRSEERANSNMFGQGLMEAADTIAAGISNRDKTRPLLASNPYSSSDRVREYIMSKMQARRMASDDEESKQSAENAAKAKSDEQAYRKDKDKKDYDLQLAKLGLDRQKLSQDMAEKKKTEKEAKNLKPTDIAGVNEGQDAMNLLSNLEGKMQGQTDNMGPILGRLKSWNPYDTEAQVLQSDVKATAQMIGKYLEGGVLRAEDVPKYEAMLPTMKDKPEVAQGKIENVRQLLKMKQDSRVNALEAQGYSTAGLKSQPMPTPTPTPAPADGVAYASDGRVKIMAPSGEVRIVDKSAAQKYLDKGGKVVP